MPYRRTRKRSMLDFDPVTVFGSAILIVYVAVLLVMVVHRP